MSKKGSGLMGGVMDERCNVWMGSANNGLGVVGVRNARC